MVLLRGEEWSNRRTEHGSGVIGEHSMALEKSKFKEKMERNCILVGLQMDETEKKLLDWTLSKLSREGDRIVAVHVCKKSGK
jgi:hypothetical protein